MKWFRVLITAAALCATVALGIWGYYAVAGVPLNDTSGTIALAAALLTLVLGASAAVNAVVRGEATRGDAPST